jgi:hypothetical protein
MADSIELHTHVDTLFATDEQGDMTVINDWRKLSRAPDFYLGRAGTEVIVQYHANLPMPLRRQLADYARQEPLPGAVSLELPWFEEAYQKVLINAYPKSSLQVRFGPAYYFAKPMGENLHPNIVKVTSDNQLVLHRYLADWLPDVDYEQPMLAWVEQGDALGICASVRCTDLAMEAGVEVTADARRRGIGREVVKAWAKGVQQLGKIALYSTSSDNEASRHLAASLDLPLLGTDFQLSLMHDNSE